MTVVSNKDLATVRAAAAGSGLSGAINKLIFIGRARR